MSEYKTTIEFHPRYLSPEIQKLIKQAIPAPESGWEITLSEFVPQTELVATQPTEDSFVRMENRMTTILQRLNELERNDEMKATTRPVSRIVKAPEDAPSSFGESSGKTGLVAEDKLEKKISNKKKIPFRIKDFVTPRHMWSVSMFYIVTLLVSGDISFVQMTGGNFILIWILAYDLLAIVGRDPNAILRMGNFVRQIAEIAKKEQLDIHKIIQTTAKEIEVREKGNRSIGFKDYVGPVDMIILCLVSLFIGFATGIMFDYTSPAFYGMIGMMIWGALSILGISQPSLEEIIPDFVKLFGVEAPLKVSTNDILKAKFGR